MNIDHLRVVLRERLAYDGAGGAAEPDLLKHGVL
jgi:hypothetical protein